MVADEKSVVFSERPTWSQRLLSFGNSEQPIWGKRGESFVILKRTAGSKNVLVFPF